MADDRKLLHEELIHTRWGDMDAMDHVNNAVYFTYFEQARVAWLDSLRESGSMSKTDPDGPVLVHVSCTFLQSVVHPRRLVVRLFGGPPGRSSFETGYEIRDADNPGILYTTAVARVVWVDHSTGHSTLLPERLRRQLPQADSA